MTKSEARAYGKEVRKRCAAHAHMSMSRQAARFFVEAGLAEGVRTVLCFAAANGEISARPLMDKLYAAGVRVCLPRTETEITALLWTPGCAMASDRWGIAYPADGQAVPPEEVDLVVVPGTAFDETGARTGYGKGFYDRYLAGTRAVRVGYTYDEAIVPLIEAEPHDARMDAVVSDKRVFYAAVPLGTNGEQL